jgi:hypothetical protein
MVLSTKKDSMFKQAVHVITTVMQGIGFAITQH